MSKSSLQGSVASLNGAVSVLKGINEGMEDTRREMDKLRTVLATNRVFGVAAESEVEEARTQVASQIHPQIMDLLDRAEQELNRLERKERTLTSKATLQKVRLQQPAGIDKPREPASAQQLAELQDLQQTRDRLAYSLKRLNLEKQKARMSLAFPGDRT